MIEPVDRLCDDFWTEDELAQMSELVINPNRMDDRPKHLCWYHLMKVGEYTGKSMLLVVESITDGQIAVNQAVESIGLTALIGDYGDESVLNGTKVESIYRALDTYRYESKVPFNGSNKVFSYEKWMAKLL